MRVSSGEVINVRKKHLTLLSDEPDEPDEPGDQDELDEPNEPDEPDEHVESGEPGEQGGELDQTPHAAPSEGTVPPEEGFCKPGGGMGGVAGDAQEQLVGDEVDGAEEETEEGGAGGEETTGSKGPKACAKQRKQPMVVPPPLTKEQALEHVQAERLTLRPGDNQSGYWNVSVLKHEDGRIRNEPYQAQVSLPRSIDHSAVRPLNGNRVHLGLFATAEEAALYVARSMEAGVAILKPEGVAHLAARPALRVRSAAATPTAARGVVKAVAVTAEDMETGPPPGPEEEMEVAGSAVATMSYEDRPSQLEGYELLLSETKSGYANVYHGTNPTQRCNPWLAKIGRRLLGSFEKPEQAALAVAKQRAKEAHEEKEEGVNEARRAVARATATLSATMVGRKELGAVQLLGLNLTAVSFEIVVDGERKTTEQFSMERRLQAQQMLREARRPQQRGLMPHHFGGPMQHNFGELHPQLRNFVAPPTMITLRVTVPPNSVGGQHVRVMTPKGLQMVQIPAGLQQGDQFDMVCHQYPQEVPSKPGPGRPTHGGGGRGGGIDLVLFNQQRRFGFSPASATLRPPLAPPLNEVAQGAGGYKVNYKQPGTNPYIEFARSRRALLPPGMGNAEREALLGRMWKALPQTERVKFTAEADATNYSVEGDEEMDEVDAEEEEPEEESELEEEEEEEEEGEVEDAIAEEEDAEEEGMEIEYPRVRLVWRGKPEVSSVDKAMVGRRIKLYWPGEDAWFSGEVVEVFNIGAVTIAKVLYDDGEEQSHHLGIWEHHWLTDEWGNAEVQTTAKPGTASAWEGLVPIKYNQQQQPTEAPVDASLIDEKLWEGAAAAGWSLKAKGGGHYIYFAPDGDKYTSKQAAMDAAGLEEVDADEEEQEEQEEQEEELEEQEEQGGEENLVDAKLWEGAASEGWSLKANAGFHYVYYSPDGRRFSSRKAAEEVRHAAGSRKRGREASDHGKGAKRAKGAKGEASRKAPADAQKWLTEGCRAEMQMQDGGMVGSRYPVRVVQLSSQDGTRRAEVLFDGLYAEVDGKADTDDSAKADAKADIDADFSPEVVDEKLWVGAATAGWRLRQRGGKSKYYYISPAGERFSSKRGAEDAAGIERVKPKPLSVEEVVQEAVKAAVAAVTGGGDDEPNQAAPAAAKATPAAAKATPAAAEESTPPLDEAGSKALVGQTIEVYWDGELRWYAAKVVGYNKAERTHTVIYVVDEMESSEALRDGGITWRPATPGAVEAERASAGAEDDSAAALSRAGRLLEWVDAAFLVPAPPERPIQARSFETIALGARLELFYEGGWWPVTVLEKKPADAQLACSGPSLHVQAIGYDVQSWAGLSAFRLPSTA